MLNDSADVGIIRRRFQVKQTIQRKRLDDGEKNMPHRKIFVITCITGRATHFFFLNIIQFTIS